MEEIKETSDIAEEEVQVEKILKKYAQDGYN